MRTTLPVGFSTAAFGFNWIRQFEGPLLWLDQGSIKETRYYASVFPPMQLVLCTLVYSYAIAI